MLSASLAFHRLFADNPADLRVKATLTLADATLLNLEGEDFMEGGFSFSQASSTESAFVIGAATVGGFDCTLNNIDGKFDEYDFTGAEIVPYVGVELAPGNVEWLCKGRFWVEQPDSYGNTIGLSCVDNMTLLEKPYSDVNTSYPATLQTIVTNICTACGIVLVTPDFPNKTYQVAERPDDAQLTCLQVVSYVAQLACSWACVDTNGRLAFRWYRTDWMDDERWLDGGTYLTSTTPYSDGDAADGGSFHSGGANMDGGSFDVVPSYALLQDIYDLAISTDDVVITGVKVTATGDDNTDGESSLYGADGYVLEVAGNPLVLLGKASAVASMVGSLVVGMRFRPFSARADVDPTVEAGDPVMFADAKGNYYKSFFTSCAWSVTGGSQAACNAETPARNSAATYSAVTAAIVANRKALRHEVTAREAAVQNLQEILATSGGLYMTEQIQPDQSVIYYLHDKRTLAQSTIVWKFTSSAFAVSVDGGQTYPFGFDAWGNAILNSIYAIGLNADYIVSGALTITDGSTTVFSADADTGVVVLQDASGNYWNMHTGQMRVSGNIVLGGLNNTDGMLIVKDASGNEISKFDNSGAYVKGDFKLLRVNANEYQSGRVYGGYNMATYLGKVPNIPVEKSNMIHGAWQSDPMVSLHGLEIDIDNGYSPSASLYSISKTIVAPDNGGWRGSCIGSNGPLVLLSYFDTTSYKSSWVRIDNTYVHMDVNSTNYTGSPVFALNSSSGLTLRTNFTVTGTKSRLAETDDYSDRLLYAYETPTPMFGDLGSGEIGEDGLCYVEIDDIFSETARTDIAYQVFLQACGRGELWVEEKAPTHFVVAGTPGLKFDWELKAKQADYEHLRLEDKSLSDEMEPEYDFGINEESAYADELRYIEEQERSLYEAA